VTRLSFPFAIGSDGRSGTVAYASDDHVRQSLKLLIMTLMGERVMRPDLGSPARQLVHRAGESPAAIALQATLEATIMQWLGHLLSLQDVRVEYGDDAALRIEVTYQTIATKRDDHAEVKVPRP